MKIKKLFLLAAFLLQLSIFSICLAQDTITLDGIVNIEKPMYLENKKLVINEGTKLIIKTDAEHAITIKKGVLIMQGTPTSPITVESLNTDKDEEDKNVFFLENSDGYITHTIYRNNIWALHVHFANLLVKNCLFEKNYGGIRLTGGTIHLSSNIFKDNEVGTRFLNSNPEISNNIYSNNNIAIFIREGVESAKIEKNVFHKNRYDLYCGFFQTKDIKASENYFYTSPTIFDTEKDSAIKSKIFIEPVLKSFPDWH